MGWALFILVNATLFLRPSELIPSLEGAKIYEALIVSCLVASHRSVLEQFSGRTLASRPIAACVAGLVVAAGLSHLSRLDFYEFKECGIEFVKLLLYFSLLVGLAATPGRLRQFLLWLAVFTLALTTLALLQYHEVVDIPAITSYRERQDDMIDEATGDFVVLARLQSTGIYHNPNDLARILVVGMIICLYFAGSGCSWAARALWLSGFGGLGYALSLTYSRGGLLALLAGVAALVIARHGPRKSALIGVPILATILLLFAGRQTNLATSEGTGQQRIRIWSEALHLFGHSPLFGVGMNNLAVEIGIGAHNSFVQCYAELGFFGGTLFFGAFFIAAQSLALLHPARVRMSDPELQRLRPYLLSIIVATIVGMLSSTRSYSLPTYMVLGLVTAYLRFAAEDSPQAAVRLDGRLMGRVAFASAITVVAIYAYVSVTARWSA